MKILKWPLEVTDHQILSLPVDAQILSVQMQNGVMCLWALCEGCASKDRHIGIYGTGQPLTGNPGAYIDTVQDGSFVWHVFEVTP